MKVSIAYGPAVVLQYAQKFTGLVVPSSLGTAAMNARFLNLQGVPVATAVTAGVLVSLGGLIVQLIVLVLGLLLTGGDINLGSIDASKLGWVILIAVVVRSASWCTLVFVVPRLRAMIVPRVRQAAGDVFAVLRSPAEGAADPRRQPRLAAPLRHHARPQPARPSASSSRCPRCS